MKKKKGNVYIVNGDVVTGIATNGTKFIFDLDKVSEFTWRVNTNGYIFSCIHFKKEDGKSSNRQLLLHRFVMNLHQSEGSKVVDHINHDIKNNCKSNLRICTHSQNLMNRPTQKNNSSGYPGIYFHKRDKVWIARIRVQQKYIFLGCSKNLEELISKRQEAEKFYFGEYIYKGEK